MLNESLLDLFYGLDSFPLDAVTEAELNKINIRQLFHSTRPEYRVLMCRYGRYSCQNDFKFIGTLQGNCLKLDLNHIPNFKYVLRS